jgi:hypothetical protein
MTDEQILRDALELCGQWSYNDGLFSGGLCQEFENYRLGPTTRTEVFEAAVRVLNGFAARRKRAATSYEPCRRPTACRGPNCPTCGYTRGDCQIQMDHSQCKTQPEPDACKECQIR